MQRGSNLNNFIRSVNINLLRYNLTVVNRRIIIIIISLRWSIGNCTPLAEIGIQNVRRLFRKLSPLLQEQEMGTWTRNPGRNYHVIDFMRSITIPNKYFGAISKFQRNYQTPIRNFSITGLLCATVFVLASWRSRRVHIIARIYFNRN